MPRIVVVPDDCGQTPLSRTAISEVTEQPWAQPGAICADGKNVRREDFVARYQGELPSAVKCFEDDFDACIAHLRFPITHRKVIRTTNLLERLFEEERWRMTIMANAFGDRTENLEIRSNSSAGNETGRLHDLPVVPLGVALVTSSNDEGRAKYCSGIRAAFL